MPIDLLRLVFSATNLILYVVAPVRLEASQATGRLVDHLTTLII